MAPWQSRTASRPDLRGNAASGPENVLRRIVNPSRLTELDLYDGSQLQAESSSSDDEGFPHRPARPQRPAGHARSMSHPFPSLLSLRKKPAPARLDANAAGGDDDETDDDVPVSNRQIPTRMQPPPALPLNHARRRGPGFGSKDFAKGNCMTCGTLVTWPKDVSVFKCNKCVTIHDLQPYNPATRRDRDGGGVRPGPPPAHDGSSSPRLPYQKASPISVDHTKTLIRQCLYAFLEDVLETEGRRTEESPLHPTNPFRKAIDEQKDSISRPPHGKNGCPSPTIHVSGYFDAALQPTLHRDKARTRRNVPPPLSLSSSFPEKRSPSYHMMNDRPDECAQPSNGQGRCHTGEPKRIFKLLEDYLVTSITVFSCVNNSFLTRRPSVSGQRPRMEQRPSIDGNQTRAAIQPRRGSAALDPVVTDRRPSFAIDSTASERRGASSLDPAVSDFDAKLLLVGDFAENGLWWTGGQEDVYPALASSTRRSESAPPSLVSSRSPRIDWPEVEGWYSAIVNAAESWEGIYNELVQTEPVAPLSSEQLREVETQILVAQEQTQRVLLKATEVLLKRPGRIITEPHELRFLLIILANPLLHSARPEFAGRYQPPNASSRDKNFPCQSLSDMGSASGRHSGIVKRIMGLVSQAPSECHNYLASWISRFPPRRFREIKDLVGSFVTYRLTRQQSKKDSAQVDLMGGLIPDMPTGRNSNSNMASLHAALERSNRPSNRTKEQTTKQVIYNDDWQIRAAARVMAIIFHANNQPHSRRRDMSPTRDPYAARERTQLHGQILPTSDFYNTLLDYADLISDFDSWEAKRSSFSFCQFPFFLSIWAKIKILEHDARRQMESTARAAIIDSIMTNNPSTKYLMLKVRRDCLVGDSLKLVSEAVGSGGEDIKKGLRIEFVGEEGVDAGGLRKEWFQLLVREVFNPDHGMFTYDEDSHCCYFNPNCFETSAQFFLVGVVLGLAIYNSTILDVAFPPFAFRKLLASAPAPSQPYSVTGYQRPTVTYTLEDLAEYRPRLAKGLRQLLEFEGDVEATFCLDFAVDIERYGTTVRVPLCPGGENIAVTNTNRREYVDLYVRYILDVSVSRQFEPFKRGFFTVCGGIALSLFRPEEIELLVRGSDEPLDISSLRAVAEYENWSPKQMQQERHGRANKYDKMGDKPEDKEPTIQWFWESFEEASPQEQRKLLTFITGSDRIPAMGAASLIIRIGCLGEDCGRFPIARTCFNMLQLHRYASKERLEKVLWGAVHGSEGFGLK